MDIIARRPTPSVQSIFDSDPIAPPAVLREESPSQDQPTGDVSRDRYYAPDWHAREVDKIWRKTWQFACRVEEIPNVGDQIVYDIVNDSLGVVRTAEGIKAYLTSCLHRGTMLRTAPTVPILLIDDVATSGAHIEEAAVLLRAAAPAVLPLVWIAD